MTAAGMEDRHDLLDAGCRRDLIFALLRDKGFSGKNARCVIVIELADHPGALQRPANGTVAVARRENDECGFGVRSRGLDDQSVDRQPAPCHETCQQAKQHRRPDHVPGGSTEHQVTCPMISEALVPPKPKEFDMALRTSRLRLFSGTRSKSATASSGSSRFSVGGRSPVWTALIE